MKSASRIAAIALILVLGVGAHAQDSAQGGSPQPPAKQNTPRALLKQLVGKWKGECRTWFMPDKLEDTSAVSGEFTPVFGGRFVRHTYTGSMKGKPRIGEDLIAYNPVDKRFESSWIDDFHMNYAILFSQGKATAKGFSVLGEYDLGPGQPKWGWRTEFELIDNDHLTITAYNIPAGRPEAKAVETKYTRITDK